MFFIYVMIRKERPAMTLNFMLQFFLLALVGYDHMFKELIYKEKKKLYSKHNYSRLYDMYYFYTCHRITANQGFYLLGLDNTSPTFASAIQNSVPAITFLMAAILR